MPGEYYLLCQHSSVGKERLGNEAEQGKVGGEQERLDRLRRYCFQLWLVSLSSSQRQCSSLSAAMVSPCLFFVLVLIYICDPLIFTTQSVLRADAFNRKQVFAFPPAFALPHPLR